MARVPRLSHIGVKAAQDCVQFDWTWSGGRSVEVRVLRSEEWFCESADAHIDGSWAQRLAYTGDAVGFADRGVAADHDLFYSVFARFPGKTWRAPVHVRVYAAGHEPVALGLPLSGREWQPPEVADGHRLVDIDGHREHVGLVDALLPDDLRDERQRAHVHGQAGSRAARAAGAAEHPAHVAPEYSAALRRWRVTWIVVGGLTVLALLVCGALVTPLAIVGLLFTAFALLRPTLGPETEPPGWLRTALLGLTVVTVMVTFALLMVSAFVASTALPVAIIVFMAFVVLAEWALPYGGLAFGHYVYGRSGLPDRVWLVALLLVLDTSCVVLGLPGALLTIIVAVGFMIPELTLQYTKKEERRATRVARSAAATEDGRRRRVEELLPKVVDPEELARRYAERLAAEAERGEDDTWEPPAYRV